MGGDVSIASVYGKGSVFTALIPQTFFPGSPLAEVEGAGEKGTLCFDRRTEYVRSIIRTLEDLGAPAKLCAGEEEFYRELESGKYAFAFTGSEYVEGAEERISRVSAGTGLVLLANPGETHPERNMPALIMPAYAVTVANMRNRQGQAERRKRRGRFVAPGARVLVVDDIQTNLTVAKGLLSIFRMEIDTSLGGEEAVGLVKERGYDMVFMDHMMPGMDGIEAVGAIRGWEAERGGGKRVPIVALTANAIAGMRELFLEKGFDDFLSKPIELAKLNEVVEKWIPAGKKEREEGGGEDGAGGFPEGITVEGIDLAAGRDCYHDAYLDILRSYCKDTAALLEKLRGLSRGEFTPEKLKEYAITVHGLKGSSYGVRAGGAAKQAEALEQAARNGDLQFIAANNGPFIQDLESLLARTGEALAAAAKPPAEKIRVSAPRAALLEKLLDACRHYKVNLMEEVLAELENYEYESDGELVSWLREQVDDLEYEAIQERLEKYA
jgi:CheY-like chemotaxis protein